MSPIPRNIAQIHARSQIEVPILKEVLKEGDIIFRLSSTQLLGGLVDFSKEIANATKSDFSHAVLVYKIENNEVILADVTPAGVTKRFLVDWYLDKSTNIVVKRVRSKYRRLIPIVLNEATKIIKKDVLYDDHFIPDDDKFYCTELVDHCFRIIGHPLANRIKIKDWPNYNLLVFFGCLFGNIDANNEVVVAGNEEIGIFSSSMLETVLDLRRTKCQ